MYEAKRTLCTHLIITLLWHFFRSLHFSSFFWIDDKWWVLLLLLLLNFFFVTVHFGCLTEAYSTTQTHTPCTGTISNCGFANTKYGMNMHIRAYTMHIPNNVSRALESFWRLQILQHPAPSTSSVSYVRVFQVLDFNYSRSDYNNDNDEKIFAHTNAR